jgi:hypothetical protein
VRSKYKQNWINHLERMNNSRLRKTSSTANLEEDEIVDAPGNDGNSSMPEQVKRPNPWRKMMMVMMKYIIFYCIREFLFLLREKFPNIFNSLQQLIHSFPIDAT